jgi:RNA polymerase sigma-70 factor (ECF subfamily)
VTPEVVELVCRAKERHEDGFLGLVALYQVPARRVAQTILGNPQDAEDAVQDAWLLTLRGLDSLRDPAHFGAWFYRIVSNVALRKRAQGTPEQESHLALVESIVQLPQERTMTANYLDMLPMALYTLSRKDYMVTALHYLSGVPIVVIASLLEISQGTVKSRLYHARQVMRKEILNMAKQDMQRPEHIPADFRNVIMGMQGKIPWQKIFNGDFSGWSADQMAVEPRATPTHWEVVGNDGLVGESYEGGGTRLTYGAATWRDVELSLLVTPLGGGNAQLCFRVDNSNNRFYVFDMLMGWQAIAINRVEIDKAGNHHFVRLSVVDYPLEHKRDYAVSIAARDHSITTYVDGALVNQVTDGAWLHGQIGLNIWHSKTLFRDIRVRLL